MGHFKMPRLQTGVFQTVITVAFGLSKDPPQIIEADRIFFDKKDMLYLILIPEVS